MLLDGLKVKDSQFPEADTMRDVFSSCGRDLRMSSKPCDPVPEIGMPMSKHILVLLGKPFAPWPASSSPTWHDRCQPLTKIRENTPYEHSLTGGRFRPVARPRGPFRSYKQAVFLEDLLAYASPCKDVAQLAIASWNPNPVALA